MSGGNHLTAPRVRTIGRAFIVSVLVLSAGGLEVARAQDCEIRDMGRGTSADRIRDRSQANFKCISDRIDALRAVQQRLQAEIDALRSQLVRAPSIAAYENANGTVGNDGRQLGPATFVLTADRRGKPTSLELDYPRLMEMCADADGCLVTLGIEGIVIGEEQLQARFTRGPCSFHIDAKTGTWALSGTCASEELPSRGPDAEPEPGAVRWGRDGDAAPLGDKEQDGRIILAFGNACFFAESIPEQRSSLQKEARFQRDTNRDLHLVAAGTEWIPQGELPRELLALRPAHAPFQCRLTIRD